MKLYVSRLKNRSSSLKAVSTCGADGSGRDYVFLLRGKGLDGLFVNVAEYSFRVIRY